MCRGRRRVENRVGMRHVTYFADRTGTTVQVFALSPGNSAWRVCLCLCVTISRARLHITAVLSEMHNLRLAPALDDFPVLQIRSVEGTRRIVFKRGVNSREQFAAEVMSKTGKPGRSFCSEAKEKGPVALASEHLFTCNVSSRKTMRWRISSFRVILR